MQMHTFFAVWGDMSITHTPVPVLRPSLLGRVRDVRRPCAGPVRPPWLVTVSSYHLTVTHTLPRSDLVSHPFLGLTTTPHPAPSTPPSLPPPLSLPPTPYPSPPQNFREELFGPPHSPPLPPPVQSSTIGSISIDLPPASAAPSAMGSMDSAAAGAAAAAAAGGGGFTPGAAPPSLIQAAEAAAAAAEPKLSWWEKGVAIVKSFQPAYWQVGGAVGGEWVVGTITGVERVDALVWRWVLVRYRHAPRVCEYRV